MAKSAACVSEHMHSTTSSPPPRPVISQDTRASKALSLKACWEEKRKSPISPLCKPLFHFHTSLYLFWLKYFTGFLAPVQVWTQCSHRDHSSHLSAGAECPQLPLFGQTMITAITTTITTAFCSVILICTHNTVQMVTVGIHPTSHHLNLHPYFDSLGPQCVSNGSCLNTPRLPPRGLYI